MGPKKLGGCGWSREILVTGTWGAPKSGHCFYHDFLRALRSPNTRTSPLAVTSGAPETHGIHRVACTPPPTKP